jgi:hypothetical protein
MGKVRVTPFPDNVDNWFESFDRYTKINLMKGKGKQCGSVGAFTLQKDYMDMIQINK